MVRNNQESLHQQKLAQYLDRIGALWFHAPNERRASVQYLVRLKREGVKKGVPDILILSAPPTGWTNEARMDLYGGYYGGDPRGVAIELKSQGVGPTQEQLAWLESMRRHGWLCAWKIGSESAIEWLVSLGYPRCLPGELFCQEQDNGGDRW